MFNSIWVDILMGCVIVRMLYVAQKGEFVKELSKLVGVFFATFVALHYYTGLGLFLEGALAAPFVLAEFLAFGFLSAFTILIFYFVREGWITILHFEAHPQLNKWGGLICASIKAYLMCGLILMFIFLTGLNGMQRNALDAFCYPLLKDVSTSVYKFSFKGFGQVFSKEEINRRAFEVTRPKKISLEVEAASKSPEDVSQ